MVKVTVQCTLEVVVMVQDQYADNLDFTIEENGCPGTGLVGNAIDRAIEHGEDNGVCWACNLKGENKILAIERDVLEES